MLNQVILVGRIKNEVEIEKKENGVNEGHITIVVPRSFKNVEGIYEDDIINITLFGSIADNTKEYCEKGSIVGIKGRIQMQDDKMEIVAEKLTFLSSPKKEDE